MKKIKLCSILCGILAVLLIYNINTNAVEDNEESIAEELLGFSSYTFHYTDEDGDIDKETFSSLSDDKSEGITIHRTAPGKVRITIDGYENEFFKTYKPDLIWIHKGDAIHDPVYFGDKPDSYYDRKLADTLVLYKIPQTQKQIDFEVKVPVEINMNLSINGLLNGDYYVIEFFTADAIPAQLKHAYMTQAYTLEELENYIENGMDSYIEDYYNIDTGFTSEKDGFTFRNTDYPGEVGVCAGLAAVSIAKYCGIELDIDKDYLDTSWYQCINGIETIRNLKLINNTIIEANSPSYNPLEWSGEAKLAFYHDEQRFPDEDSPEYVESDDAFVELVKDYKLSNNATVVFECGNYYLGDFRIRYIPNNWNMINLVLAELRQGKPVMINVGAAGGGHTVVGYKFAKVDEDTYRLYCYDSNYPDDMMQVRLTDEQDEQLKSYFDSYSGSLKNLLNKDYVWCKKDVYIELKKCEAVYYNDYTKNKSIYEYFTYDTSALSVKYTNENSTLSFTKLDGDDIELISVHRNDPMTEIISVKAFAMAPEDGSNEIQIRTFAFYKSGMVREITDYSDTCLSMEMSHLGDYSISGSKIILSDKYVYDENGTEYVDCYVTYNDGDTNYNKLRVRVNVKVK